MFTVLGLVVEALLFFLRFRFSDTTIITLQYIVSVRPKIKFCYVPIVPVLIYYT